MLHRVTTDTANVTIDKHRVSIHPSLQVLYMAIVVRCWCPSSPLRPAPPPGCAPALPWPQYSCRFCRRVTSAEPRQARLGARMPPGSWMRTVATPAMPSSVGSRVMGPHLEGGVGEAHELGEEGVRAAEVLVATVRGRVVVVVGGRGATSGAGAGVVVGVEVVQGQVLPAVAPAAQVEVVVMVVVVVVRRGPGARLVLVRDGASPATLADHHGAQLAGAGVGQGHSAAPPSPAHRRQVDELRLLGLQVHCELGEGTRRHLGHLLDVTLLLPPEVQELFDLPEEHAHRQEEEEAGEEDGEEDEEVDVGLVLPQEQQALGLALLLRRAHAPQCDVEAAGLERVHLVGEGDDHTVADAAHDQHRLGLPHGDVGDEPLRPLLPHLPLRPGGGLGLQLQGVAGQRRTGRHAGRGVGKHLHGGRWCLLIAACHAGTRRRRVVFDPEGVHARVAVDVHSEGIVGVGHVHLHLAKGDVDGDTDVHVGELGLGAEEDGAAAGQVADGRVVEAVGLGGGVEAALAVHVELPVTLAPVHRRAVEGVLTLGALQAGGESAEENGFVLY